MGKSEQIIIVGGGLIGSAAAYQTALLAKAEGREVDILLLEAGKKGELRGGSEGNSRITREITFENSTLYPALAFESNQLADKLGALRPANALILGNDPNYILNNAFQAAESSKANYNLVDAETLQTEFSYLNGTGLRGVNEHAFNSNTGKGAGVLNPALLTKRLQEEAEKLGVTIRYESPVKKVTDASGVTITLESGETLHPNKAVVAVGAWAEKILDHSVAKAVTPKMGPLFYYQVAEGMEDKIKDFPAIIYKLSGGPEFIAQHPEFIAAHPKFPLQDKSQSEGFYMMRETDENGQMWIKVGHSEPAMKARYNVDELKANYVITDELQAFTAAFMREFLPGLSDVIPSINTGKADKIGKGPMAFTPEDHPIIDYIGTNKDIVFVEFCNGGGAKTACAVGQMVAQYALGASEKIPEIRRKAFSLEGREPLQILPQAETLSSLAADRTSNLATATIASNQKQSKAKE